MAWLIGRKSSNRDGLAMHIIRNASKVFGGVGKYIVCEAFARAGMLYPARLGTHLTL